MKAIITIEDGELMLTRTIEIRRIKPSFDEIVDDMIDSLSKLYKYNN